MTSLNELLVRDEHFAAVEAALRDAGYHLARLPREHAGALPSYLVTRYPDGLPMDPGNPK